MYAWSLFFLLLIPLRDARSFDAQARYDSAWTLFIRGKLSKSQEQAEQGYLKSVYARPDWASKFQLLEAEAMEWRGMYEDALALLSESQLSQFGPDERVRALAIEGVAHAHLHQFAESKQALSLAETSCRGAIVAACGSLLRARAILAIQMGELEDARQYFGRSLSFSRVDHDQLLELTSFSGLGFIALQKQRYDEAVDWSKSTYQAARRLGAEDMVQVASGNLGWAYFEIGNSEKALELFLDAERHASELGDVRFQIKWLTATGYVYQNVGNLKSALQSDQQALDLARRINDKEAVINCLEDLAHMSIEMGDSVAAERYSSELSPLISSASDHLDVLALLLIEARIAVTRGQYEHAESLFQVVESDVRSQTSMKLGAQHELAKLYEFEGKDKVAEGTYRTTLTTFETARAQLKNEDSKLPFLANATPIYDDYIHFLVEHGKAEEALAVADQSRARTLEQGLGLIHDEKSFKPEVLHPTAVARATGATLLFYWLGAKQSYLWAISPAKTQLLKLPAQREITSIVERYQRSLQGPEDPLAVSNPDGLALYRMLVEPAQSLLRKNAKVVILGDGPLTQLNFETLLVPGPKPHYWIEDATVISAPSLYMLARAKPDASAGHKLLMMGDAISPNPDFPELSLASLEMKQVRGHFAPANETVLARAAANPGAYLASHPQQYGYIHFVAHGTASRTDPLDSAIILSRTAGSDDSFKLYARDIIQHPLHARLVTISACYGSGTRSYAGEGLVGLAWAFLRAGAHNVIGALWEASDESTPRLMDALYRGIDQGMAPGAALRQAKLELLHGQGNFRSPFYWAPFQLYAGL